MLLFPLTLVLMSRWDRELLSVESALLLGSVILLGSRYSLDRFPLFHQGVPSLFATGKLLGAVCLAWLLTRLISNRAQSKCRGAD